MTASSHQAQFDKDLRRIFFGMLLLDNEFEIFSIGDRRLTKQFCFLDADCLVVGESQGSSQRSVGKYPVKPPHPEGDSQTIDTYYWWGKPRQFSAFGREIPCEATASGR